MKTAALFVAGVVGLAVSASAEPAALVQLATAQRGALHPVIRAYGTVAPDPGALVTIALPRDGVIAAVSVRAGQFVHAGDAVATVQTAASELAAFAQAKSALEFAGKDLVRTRQLYAQQLATATQLAAAEKAVSDARAALAAQTAIGAGKGSEVLRAKAHGVVTAVSISPGDRVQANAVIASVATRDRFIVNLGIEPAIAPEVARGDRVSLREAQRPGTELDGTVQSVDAMMDPKSRLVNALVSIPERESRRLLLGTVLDGTIYPSARNGIVVPQSALMSDVGGSFVYVVGGGAARRRPVRVLFEAGSKALLASGVSPGEAVVVAGNAGLQDGTHVRTR